MGLYRSQRGEEDTETEWKCLRHNNTGSTINTCIEYLNPTLTFMENYENSNHDQRVESCIHFLYRNWREDSETEWRGQEKKIGGTKSKSNCLVHLKR